MSSLSQDLKWEVSVVDWWTYLYTVVHGETVFIWELENQREVWAKANVDSVERKEESPSSWRPGWNLEVGGIWSAETHLK